MTNLHDLTVAELRKVVAIKEQIEALQSELDSVAGSVAEVPEPAANGRRKKRRHMSAAARARIGAAQRARWAKARKAARAAAPAKKKKRRVSRAARAKLSAAAKARWASAKASGKSTL
jgi:phage protein D